MGFYERMLAEIGHGMEIEIERVAGQDVLSGDLCVPSRQQARHPLGVMREEYSDRKLFFGMALRPQNKARPSSAMSDIMWLLRSIDHNLSASEVRSAWAAGIMLEPGNLPAPASSPSPSNCTRSGMNRNSPPIRVVNSRSVRMKSLTLAIGSTVGATWEGRSSSRRRGRGAKPSAARTS